MHSSDEDVQVTVEQQALEDYLLSDPPMKAAASQLLSVRAASPDVVTQVLTQLSSKPPQELWSLIHADAAAAGKPAKAAPVKAPAAVKGKAGELYHPDVTIIITIIIIIVTVVVIIIVFLLSLPLSLPLSSSLSLSLSSLLCHHIHAGTQLTIRRVVVCHEKVRW